jgi:hypothetical protein
MDFVRVADFLARHPGKPFCSTCVAFEMCLSLERVRAALARLAEDMALQQALAECGICGRLVVVVSAVPAEARPPGEVIRELFAQCEYRFLCHTCIARRTGLPVTAIQKTLWGLQAALELERTVDCCAICARLRLVVGRNPAMPFRNETDAGGWPRCPACGTVIRPGEAIARTTTFLVHAACAAAGSPATGH